MIIPPATTFSQTGQAASSLFFPLPQQMPHTTHHVKTDALLTAIGTQVSFRHAVAPASSCPLPEQLDYFPPKGFSPTTHLVPPAALYWFFFPSHHK